MAKAAGLQGLFFLLFDANLLAAIIGMATRVSTIKVSKVFLEALLTRPAFTNSGALFSSFLWSWFQTNADTFSSSSSLNMESGIWSGIRTDIKVTVPVEIKVAGE